MVAPVSRQKIAVLGGSFNPAHNGHVGVSLAALQHLNIDAVWWLITPQNPLKQGHSYIPLPERIAQAQAHTAHVDAIVVKDIETALQSTYTVDVIRHLQRTHADTHFIWLMGADNMVTFHLWHRWQDITRMVPIAVFARPNTHFDSLQNSPCYDILQQVPVSDIWQNTPHIWTYIDSTHYTECATDIRHTTHTETTDNLIKDIPL